MIGVFDMNKKNFLSGCLGVFLLTGFAIGQEVDVKVDGDRVNFFHQAPIIENSRVLIPLRGVFEKMGASVVWHPDTRTVTATRGDDEVEVTIASFEARVNGRVHELDVTPRIESGRTLVPLRFISESLEARVEWKSDEKTVLIASDGGDNLQKDPVSRDFYTTTGTVVEAGPGIYMQGTHELEDSQGEMKALLSASDSEVDLNDYLGDRVRVRGVAEQTVEGDATIIRVKSVERI